MYGTDGQTEQTAQSEWTQHNDPKGFALTHPDGWTVETAPDGRILVRSPYPGLFVLIHRSAAQNGGPEAWIPQAGALYPDLFPNAMPQSAPQRRPGGEVIGDLIFDGGGQPAKANLLCTGDGTIYAVAAPLAIFEGWRPALVHILQSLRFTRPAAPAPMPPGMPVPPNVPGANPSGGLTWERWMDPMEQAFDLEVPRGWQVNGGMFRGGTMDVRPEVRISAPDGSILIFGGDRNIPTFALPTQIGMSLGFFEGAPYNPGGTGQMIIYNYRPGPVFAREYVQTTIARQFGGVQFTGMQERPDLTRQALAGQNLLPGQQLDIGEVTFTANAGGRPMRGYCRTATALMGAGMMEGGIWNVTQLIGYIAAPEKEQTAQAMMDRIEKSFRMSPQWNASQQQLTAQSGQIAREHQQWTFQQQQKAHQTMQETTDIINQSYWDRQRSQDEQQRHFGNVIRGETDVRDANTGEEWRVSSGSNHYWRQNGTDVIVGTDTYDRPDIDFTPLKEF